MEGNISVDNETLNGELIEKFKDTILSKDEPEKTDEEEETSVTAPGDEKIETDEDKSEEDNPSGDVERNYPKVISEEEKEILAKLDDATWNVISKRLESQESMIGRQSKEVGQYRKEKKEIEAVRNANKEIFGDVPVQQTMVEIASLLNHAKSDPNGFVLDIASKLGVDLPSLLNMNVDKEKAALLSEKRQAEIKSKVEKELSSQDVEASVEDELEAFYSTHPDLDKYADDMSMFINAGKAETLEEAYALAKKLAGDHDDKRKPSVSHEVDQGKKAAKREALPNKTKPKQADDGLTMSDEEKLREELISKYGSSLFR